MSYRHSDYETDEALQKALLKSNGVVTAFPSAKTYGTVTLSKTSYERESAPENPYLSTERERRWEETEYQQQQFSLTFDFFRGVEDESQIPYTSYYSNPPAEKLMEQGKELHQRMVPPQQKYYLNNKRGEEYK